MSKQSKMFNGMEILLDDMQHLQLTKEEMSIERNQDYFSPGIVNAGGVQSFQMAVDGTTSSLINVGFGKAFDNDGEHIVISENRSYVRNNPLTADNPFYVGTYGDCPISTGNLGIPLVTYGNGEVNYVWIQYLDTLDPSYLSPDVWGGTGPKYTKQTQGYNITIDRHVPTTGISTMASGGGAVYLGKITAGGVGVALSDSNINQTGLSLSRLNMYGYNYNDIVLYGQSKSDAIKGYSTQINGVVGIAGITAGGYFEAPDQAVYGRATTTNKAGVYGDPIVQASSMVTAPIIQGTTIGAVTSITAPTVAATTTVTAPTVVASTSIQSPVYNNNVISPLIKSTGGLEGLTLSITPTSAVTAVTIDQNNDEHALRIDTEATTVTKYGLYLTCKMGAFINPDVSSGWGLWVSRGLGETGTYPLANFYQTNASTTQPTMYISTAGAADGLQIINAAANGRCIYGQNNYSSGYTAHFHNDGNNADRYGIFIMAGADDASGTTTMIMFADGDGGFIGDIRNTNGTISLTAFTGSHLGKTEGNKEYEYGTIMTAEAYENPIKKHKAQPCYIVEPSKKEKDKRCFGVYMCRDISKENEHTIFGLGDGHILVCNEGGNITTGDYITSSNKIGYGMKQDDDLLHNYTVAKAAESVDWDKENGDTKLIACTYHAS